MAYQVAEMVTLARFATGATMAGMAVEREAETDVNMASTEACEEWSRQLNYWNRDFSVPVKGSGASVAHHGRRRKRSIDSVHPKI